MADAENLLDGRQTVTTPGTPVQLIASSVLSAAESVMVQALPTNTGVISVGASTTRAAVGSRRGAVLSAGQSVSIDIGNPSSIFIDAAVGGEGVSYLIAY